MHAYLITGKTKGERRQKAQELVAQKQIKEVFLLTTESKHTIEQVRNLKQQLSLAPQNPKIGRAVVLEEAQLLTHEAANALLKSLEEPLGPTLFILTASNGDQVPETICSRCQVLNLGYTPYKQADARDQEKLKYILSLTAAKRLEYLERIDNRRKASAFCQELVLVARLLLLKNPQGENLDLVERLEAARIDAENNVNVKLALGDLFLNFPHLARVC